MAERLIFGFHPVSAVLRQDAARVLEIFVDAARHDGRMATLLEAAQARGVRVMPVDGKRLDGLAGGGRHQGVVARLSGARADLSLDQVLEGLEGPALLLVLDGVQDPHNLGACLRSADALGAHAVIAPRDRAVGLNATVAKVASGAAETVPYVMVTNLARALAEIKEYGVWLVGMDSAAPAPLAAMELAGPVGLVLGSEGEGLRRLTREGCDFLARIPMQGSVESLNVSVSAAICLYEARRQRDARTAP